MKIFVTGVNGQLGHDVAVELIKRGHTLIGSDIAPTANTPEVLQAKRLEGNLVPEPSYVQLDITDAEAVSSVLAQIRPDAVIHCAAYTAVDKAESEPELCRKVNVDATRNVAKACKALDVKMIYISTDYVFSGEGETPFETDEPYNPKNVYGVTKADGEKAVRELLEKYFIVRISWAFGINGSNFVKTILRLGKERPFLKVVYDQIGSPTYTEDLAGLLVDMVTTDKYGIYHATNEGYCSWAEFARAIMDLAGLSCKINPVPTPEYPTPAKRPMNSRLSKRSLDEAGFHRLPDWHDALERYFALYVSSADSVK